MGKAERNRQQNARQRIALQQAAAKRAEARRKMFITGGSVLLVIVIVVAFIVIKSLNHSTPGKASAGATTTAKTDATVASEITSIPAAVMNQVGAGPTGPTAVSPLKAASGTLTENGKPEVLYMGAEYCPYCAAERWAMVVALSRFGTFTNLHFIHSSSTDNYASTPTLTFYGSTYTSKYLTFTPVEGYNTTGGVLQKPTAAQTALINKYTQGEFPFVDVGGKYVVDGAQYLPSTFGSIETAGEPQKNALTWAEIANDLQNPNNAVGQEVIGAANHITAAICKVTGGQPGSVCKSPAVTKIGSDI
jgi:thiol-disulfide isomerase/thioredoxin